MERVIGIGEYAVSDDYKDVLKTYALATCVALTVYSPVQKVLGMVHIALPSSNIDKEKSFKNPGYFADTAVPALINTLYKDFGCTKNGLVVKLFGGAQSNNEQDVFNIGQRNIRKIEEILLSYNIPFNKNETGGFFSRTIEADVATGTVKMNMQPMARITKENRNGWQGS